MSRNLFYVPGMAQFLQVKVPLWVFIAKCSESQTAAGNVITCRISNPSLRRLGTSENCLQMAYCPRVSLEEKGMPQKYQVTVPSRTL